MMKEILITIIFASLMLVTPFTTIAQENKLSYNLSEQPNDIEGLVAQLRVAINEISQKYGHIPIIRSLSNMILHFPWYPGKITICVFLIFTLSFFIALWIYWGQIFYISVYNIFFFLARMVAQLFLKADCDEFFYYYPLKPISTLSGKNDISKLVDNCPCMQE